MVIEQIRDFLSGEGSEPLSHDGDYSPILAADPSPGQKHESDSSITPVYRGVDYEDGEELDSSALNIVEKTEGEIHVYSCLERTESDKTIDGPIEETKAKLLYKQTADTIEQIEDGIIGKDLNTEIYIDLVEEGNTSRLDYTVIVSGGPNFGGPRTDLKYLREQRDTHSYPGTQFRGVLEQNISKEDVLPIIKDLSLPVNGVEGKGVIRENIEHTPDQFIDRDTLEYEATLEQVQDAVQDAKQINEVWESWDRGVTEHPRARALALLEISELDRTRISEEKTVNDNTFYTIESTMLGRNEFRITFEGSSSLLSPLDEKPEKKNKENA